MKEGTLDRVYDFIRDYRQEHGYGPSFADIADGCRITIGAVARAARILRERGKVDFVSYAARSIHLTDVDGGGRTNRSAIRQDAE